MMLAHIAPLFHGAGAGFFLILLVLIVACALILTSGSKKGKITDSRTVAAALGCPQSRDRTGGYDAPATRLR